MKISRVDAPRCLVGEGPVWDVAEQALYYLDIIGKKIHRYEPATGATHTWETPTSVGAMALRGRTGAVISQDDGLHAIDFKSGAVSLLARLEGKPERARFNDGKADRRGRFVVGLSDSNFQDTLPIGGLYGLGADRKITQLDKGIHFSNSPCFSPDDRTLYFADSFRYELYAYDYDIATGQVANRRVFVNTRELGGMPDGATVDSDGIVWIAIFESGTLVALKPDGKVERTVSVPVRMASSVMFGGADLTELYVTSVDPSFFGGAKEDGAGHLYVIEGLGARGLPEPRFAG
jgi:sugar lactone lactonase YvrE